MNIEKIIEIFSRLSGMDSEEAVKFSFICDSALEYILSHLKQGTDARNSCGRLEFAAATLAYYRYTLWSLTDGCDNIKIGEISVSSSGPKQLESTQKLCSTAFEDIADIFDTGVFFFEGV